MKSEIQTKGQVSAAGSKNLFFKSFFQPKNDGSRIAHERLLELWEACRAQYHSPVLPVAKMRMPPGRFTGGWFDFEASQAWIDPGFVARLSGKSGLGAEEIAIGLKSRQIGAYMNFPRNLANTIMLWKIIEDNCKGCENGDYAFHAYAARTFANLVNDATNMLYPDRAGALLTLRRAIEIAGGGDPEQELSRVYLEMQAGMEPEIRPGLKQHIAKLLSIDIEAIGKDQAALRRAVIVWMGLLRSLASEGGKGKSFGFGRKRGGAGGFGAGKMSPDDMDPGHSMKSASSGSISKALALISKNSSHEEFRKVKEMLGTARGDNNKEKESPGEKGAGTGAGQGRFRASAETVEYYIRVAQNYPVIAGRNPIESTMQRKGIGGSEKFRLSSDPTMLMPYTSGGNILPGITLTMKNDMRNKKSVEYDTADALIIIDSSESMPDPEKLKAAAPAAGTSAAMSYLNLGGRVGVINFGPKTYYLPYTYVLEEIVGAICAYQKGGTIMDTGTVKAMLGADDGGLDGSKKIGNGKGQGEKNVEIGKGQLESMLAGKSIDVIVFSDMKITNLKEVVSTLEEKASVNRVTIISETEQARMKLASGTKIKVYPGMKDIRGMVGVILEQAEESIKQHEPKKQGDERLSIL